MDVKGKADVMFFNRLDAVTAVKKFNGLTLDGRPMIVALKESAAQERGIWPPRRHYCLAGAEVA